MPTRVDTALLEFERPRNANSEVGGRKPPHGGILTELLDPERRAEFRALAVVAAGFAEATCTLVPKNEWDVSAGSLLFSRERAWRQPSTDFFGTDEDET
jgi:hypothetical protein